MLPGKKFDPATETSRRPTPEVFAHLRKWVAVVEHNIDITNITEIKNINQQLEQTAKLYVSNVISRVIAQLTGAYGEGFVTLEATEDGELKVQLAAGVAEIGKLAAGTAQIGSVQNAGTSKTILRKAITFAAAASNEIVAAVAGKKIKITNLAFTVFGETNITLQSAANAMSGAMDFGAADEPRGMVQHFGDFPLETVAGEAFNILASAAVQVSGYVTYYTE